MLALVGTQVGHSGVSRCHEFRKWWCGVLLGLAARDGRHGTRMVVSGWLARRFQWLVPLW